MISLSFESFEEMQGFATKLLSGSDHSQSMAQVTVKPPIQQVPVQQAAVQRVPAQQTPPVQQQAPAQQAPPVQQPTGVATAQTTYTLDDLARAGMTLMDLGKQADLQQLLTQFGVAALPALAPDQYGAFATALRGLGAQI